MHKKGSILLVLMLMLLFTSPLLLQLSEDNYFMHLLARELDDVTQSRQALIAVFNTLLEENRPTFVCETSADTPSELESFWSTSAQSCQVVSSGILVKYALYHDEGGDETQYQQYTLQAQNSWLRVVVDLQANKTVSWLYY